MPTITKRQIRRSQNVQVDSGDHKAAVLQAKIARQPLATSAAAPPVNASRLLASEWQAIAVCLAFSTRESQVARMLMDDVTEPDIAVRLSISTHTVHAHVERLYRKLLVHSRHQLILRIFNAYLSCCAGRQN